MGGPYASSVLAAVLALVPAAVCAEPIAVTSDTTLGFLKSANEAGQWSIVAAHPGPPRDGVRCSTSLLTVGDSVPTGRGHFTTVVDINPVWQGNRVIGWVYRGADRGAYWQPASGEGQIVRVSHGTLPLDSRVVACFKKAAKSV